MPIIHATTAVHRDDLRQGLIVSCQPVPDGPTDTPAFVIGFAQAAVAAGACAIRIESLRYVAAVRAAVSAPIIGIVKRDLDDSPVRITPFVADVEALADAGADIIAFDATDRARPETVTALVAAIRAKGRLAMADCSSLDDARRALDLGVDFVGTTLSGYVAGPVQEKPDFALIAAMAKLTPYVIAEGRLKTPGDATAAAEAGAFAVVVGSAITRTEHATAWFLDAVRRGYAAQPKGRVLAIDLGGTKTLVALIDGAEVLKAATIATRCEAGPQSWLEAARAEAQGLQPAIAVGIAVTGFVRDGAWSAINAQTLAIPDDFPLVETAASLFGDLRTIAFNDAQAAAWGEYRHGAGQGSDSMAFLTISTGVGRGIVLSWRLLSGLTGHFGQMGAATGDNPVEDRLSGRWIAAEARRAGDDVDAKAVFAAAATGKTWASAIIEGCATGVAGLCRDIKMALDVELIVIGGGVGLAPGFLPLVCEFARAEPACLRARIVPAALGSRAGIIGIADLAAASIG